MVGEEHEPLLELGRRAGAVERLRSAELGAGPAGVVAEQARRDQLAQVAPAGGALDQGDEASRSTLGARRGDLGADDRPHAGRLGRPQEIDHARERIDVGERQGGEAELAGALEQRARGVDAGEQRVVPVDAQRHVARLADAHWASLGRSLGALIG